MGTIIQENVNPIERVEQSTLIIASTIHGSSIPELIKGESESTCLSVLLPLFVESE